MARKLASQPIGVRSSLVTSHTHAYVHQEVSRFFSSVSNDRSFKACDGRSIDSVWSLAEHLKVMHPDSYAYHANDSKNDFASWLRDVHNNHDLADRLLSAKGKDHAAKIVSNHIVGALHDAAHR